MIYFSLFGTIFGLHYILTPKLHTNTFMALDHFNEEHDIKEFATIGELKFYKTSFDNFNAFENTLNSLFDIELEQEFRVREPNFILVDSAESSPVPWHLDRISKRNLPFDGKFPYSESGSCHKNSDVEIHTYVVDTGCDPKHPELGGRAEFLENFTDDNIDTDANSHGTFCSSQIGGNTVGVCKDAKIYCVKVLDGRGSGSTSGVIAGMEYVFKRHLENEKRNPKVRSIMSMSLGGGKSYAMNRAVENMVKTSNTFYITVASGNEDSDACNTSPASARGIFTANAMDKYDQRAYFSNYGRCTDIYSPGVDNYGAVLNGKYAVESGTSFSTPIIAGVLNHYIDMYPSLNMKQLKEKVLSDATKDTIKNNPKNTPNSMVFLHRNGGQ
jgi:hypothetical protein